MSARGTPQSRIRFRKLLACAFVVLLAGIVLVWTWTGTFQYLSGPACYPGHSCASPTWYEDPMSVVELGIGLSLLVAGVLIF